MSDTATIEKQHKKNTSTPSSEQSMVVRLSRLDNMLELAGQVIIVSSNLNSISRDIREGAPISHILSEDIKDLAVTSTRISSDLHSLVTDVRTVDMGDLFARFRRLARDTSRRLGKAIRFEVEGEDVCIDKKTSEKIYDPIAHQIRNAIAHGIENEKTRKNAGKDPVGTVTVKVRNTDNNTVIDIIDDGGGIDTDAVRRRAVKMRIADEKAMAGYSDEELYELLYLPGFSTADETSTTSGRGVGLDVVRNIMNEINGETRIKSERGKGTTFSFILPAVTAVNISDALLVRAGTMTFAFPITSVLSSQAIAAKDITTMKGRNKSIVYLDTILPLFDLLEIFGEQALENDDNRIPVLILEYKHKRAAFIVSDFISPQKIVISEFDENMTVPGLVGTAILSGRRMGLVADLKGLFDQTFGSENHLEMTAPPTAHITEETDSSEHLEPPSVGDKEDKPGGDYEGLAVETCDSAFLKEVELMLSQLNRRLLILEEKRDTETSDSVFRLMHSIKGNLTMYGAVQPASITHEVETILDRAKRGMLELDEDVFDCLFDSSSYLEEVVTALLKEQNPPAAPAKLLEGIAKFQQTQNPPASAGKVDLDNAQAVLDPTGEFYLSSRRRQGANLRQCRIEFDPGDQPRFLVAYLILRRIQYVADVLGTFPPMSDIEAGRCESGLVALIAPRSQEPEMVENLTANLKRYYGVTRFAVTDFA